MHRGGLVDAANDRLEVVDVERPRIEVSVPADDVERMVVENKLVQAVVLLNQQTKVAHLVVGSKLDRAADVALGVWRALLELTELVSISLGPAHMAAALHDEELW